MMGKNKRLGLRNKILLINISLLLLLSITMLSVVFYEITKTIDDSIYSQLNSNINLGYSMLDKKYPGEWKVDGGRLFKGNKLINGDIEFVDEFKSATNSPATIFMGDTRVSTNILKEGERAIGTKVSNEVADIVINQGKEFLGEAIVVDKKYVAKYMPIKDVNGKVIGIWFTGVEQDYVKTKIENLMYKNAVITIIITIIAVIISFTFANTINKNIKRILETLRLVSSGDLSKECRLTSRDEIEEIAVDINEMIFSMKKLIQEMKNKSEQVYDSTIILNHISKEMLNSSENVSSAIQNVTTGAYTQAQDLSDISEIINDFRTELDNIVSSIKNIEKDSNSISGMVIENNDNMEGLIKSVQEMKNTFESFKSKILNLGKNINRINEITAVIKTIANQTNLLALNAAIEAARAGESGRGFSVVADEIRKLAEQSRVSSETISDLIDNISKETVVMIDNTGLMGNELNNQLDDINTTINSFGEIIASIDGIIPQIHRVSSASNSINSKASLIGGKIETSSSIAEEASASSEEIAAAAEEMSASSQEVAATAEQLSKMTNDMLSQANKFKL